MLLTEAQHVVELLHVPLVALGLKPRPVHIDLDMGHARESLIGDHAAAIRSARESRNIERAIDEGYVLDRFRQIIVQRRRQGARQFARPPPRGFAGADQRRGAEPGCQFQEIATFDHRPFQVFTILCRR